MKKKTDLLFSVLCVLVVLGYLWTWMGRRQRDRNWEKEKQERIAKDFRRSYQEVKDYVAGRLPDVTDEQMEAWSASNRLENRIIDGERRYFRNAGPNLFRIDKGLVQNAPEPFEGHVVDDAAVIPLIVDHAWETGEAAGVPRTFQVRYTLTVNADAVPAGETIRCWLPYPRADVARQKNVELLGASEENPVLSAPSYPHSTLYMEKKAEAGKPTVFWEEFRYTALGEWHPLSASAVKPYDKSSKLYKEYTAERSTHIRFTPEIRALVKELSGSETNPYLLARRFFVYVNDNFPWASALEYSIQDNIPLYVLQEGHGDCGMVTLLYLTLCRCAGIPARWQSGFMMHPSGWNLHDWGELYFEGVGWVPVDMSFGIPSYAVRTEPLVGEWAPHSEPQLSIPEAEFFYLGGIDPYRMIVNTDYSGVLNPHKRFPRSETVDFQRGEVEWKGGNLYFDQWDYHMDISYE